MRHPIRHWPSVCLSLICLTVSATFVGGEEPPGDKKITDKASASRLKAVRQIMGQITMTSTAGQTPAPLELKPDPLLRYNDVTRGILDSVVFRVGTKGRPVALISAELYGREGKKFLLNHEFVALYEPKLQMERDVFAWKPPTGTLTFQEFSSAEPPAENPRLRLTQMRRLSEQFTASQMVGASRIELRRMATPLDRYEPSSDARADGSLFAFAWGVNPEAVLFIETDGQKWIYGWAPLSSAPLEAKLGEAVVWKCPSPTDHESPTAPYTSIYRQLVVPDDFDKPVEDK
jgi:hypothetical protein